jgi:hypothetical protein
MGRTRKLLAAVAVCTTAVVGLSASAAFAGERIGPPGTPNVPDSGSGIPTAGPAHANSICVFNGLNDMTVGEGPIDFIVQSYGQDVRTGLADPHEFGPGIACRGGSN